VAVSLNNLASVYRHQGRRDEAEALARESVGIRQKMFGDDSLEVADSLHNLSVVLADEGNLAESEATARRMLAIRRKLLGPEDRLVASALADVSWVVSVSGKLDEAVSLEREALTMQQKLLGDGAPEVAKSLNNLSQLLGRPSKTPESLAILQEIHTNQNQLFGKDNPISLDTLRSLGLVLEGEGKLADSEMVYREALGSWCKRGASETPEALFVLERLATVLIVQKKFSDAKELLDETLTPTFVRQPASGNLLAIRVDLQARRGQWQEAATDAALAFELQPQKDERYSMLAALLLKTRNRPAYEQLRKQLLITSANTTNIFVADQVAKACLFLPPSKMDLPVIAHLANTAVTLGAIDSGAMPFFEVCKALSEYRQGNFAEAVEWAQKPLEIPDNYSHGHAYAILAMADWQLGEKDEARAMLAKGNELAPSVLPVSIAEDPSNAWLAWLFARIQLDEANALIQP
jgi:tetratricopeptide (TPR) repeat protein